MIYAQVREVKRVSPNVDLTTGIPNPKIFGWLKPTLNYNDMLQQVQQDVPVDGQEVVAWMQIATAMNAMAQSVMQTYNSIGSIGGSSSNAPLLQGTSGDGFIPGVYLNNIHFLSQNGYYVNSQNHAIVVTPYGNFNVPVGGNTIIAINDLLAWAAVPYTYWIQFLAILFNWLKLAKIPFNQRVTFPTAGDMVGPQFFDVNPSLPTPGVLIDIGVTSPQDQDIVITGRGPSGNYQQQMFTNNINVKSGQSDIILFAYGIPTLSEFTLQILPQQSQTVIDYIKTYPPIY